MPNYKEVSGDISKKKEPSEELSDLHITEVIKESMNITDELLKELKLLLPHVFTERKIDFNKLKLTLGEKIADKEERYSFNWAGRKEAFKNIQTTAKGTLIPDKKESFNFDTTENIFIEGDNLEVLKLLQKAYFNKIKMIYIDPPYNTGKDFVYKDNFRDSIESYLEQTGQISQEGFRLTTNPDSSGRFHSDWISMMYPRLFVARNLLKDDGVIFASIDDNEVHNLRFIMNEIFGEENFIVNICHKSRASVSNDKIVSTSHNHILLYAKNYDTIFNKRKFFGLDPNLDGFKFDDNDGRGKYKLVPVDGPGGLRKGNPHYEFLGVKNFYRYSKETMQKKHEQGLIVKRKNSIYQKYFINDAKEKRKTDTTWWDEGLLVSTATSKLKDLMGDNVFNNPKPVDLIKRMLKLSTFSDNENIVLDFFAGSGTTAQAVLEINKEEDFQCKFILIQLPEITDKESIAYEAGYNTIADISKERIKRVIKKIENKNKLIEDVDLGFKVFKLSKSNFKIWEDYDGKDTKELKEQLTFFSSPLIENYKRNDVIYECLIKEGYSLNSKIEEIDIESNIVSKVTDDDNSFYICLDPVINDETIDKLELDKDNIFICIDDALDDTKKSNLAVQCNLKTI